MVAGSGVAAATVGPTEAPTTVAPQAKERRHPVAPVAPEALRPLRPLRPCFGLSVSGAFLIAMPATNTGVSLPWTKLGATGLRVDRIRFQALFPICVYVCRRAEY